MVVLGWRSNGSLPILLIAFITLVTTRILYAFNLQAHTIRVRETSPPHYMLMPLSYSLLSSIYETRRNALRLFPNKNSFETRSTALQTGENVRDIGASTWKLCVSNLYSKGTYEPSSQASEVAVSETENMRQILANLVDESVSLYGLYTTSPASATNHDESHQLKNKITSLVEDIIITQQYFANSFNEFTPTPQFCLPALAPRNNAIIKTTKRIRDAVAQELDQAVLMAVSKSEKLKDLSEEEKLSVFEPAIRLAGNLYNALQVPESYEDSEKQPEGSLKIAFGGERVIVEVLRSQFIELQNLVVGKTIDEFIDLSPSLLLSGLDLDAMDKTTKSQMDAVSIERTVLKEYGDSLPTETWTNSSCQSSRNSDLLAEKDSIDRSDFSNEHHESPGDLFSSESRSAEFRGHGFVENVTELKNVVLDDTHGMRLKGHRLPKIERGETTNFVSLQGGFEKSTAYILLNESETAFEDLPSSETEPSLSIAYISSAEEQISGAPVIVEQPVADSSLANHTTFLASDGDFNELYDVAPVALISSEADAETEMEEVDIAIVGAGIGGLCAGAILNSLYNKKVGVYESHYIPGGCAHAFDRVAKVSKKDVSEREKDTVVFTFDSGPTILMGCSTKPYNPLRQVLNAVGLGDEVEWLQYDGWGMIENPGKGQNELRWKAKLGPELFETGPLTKFGGSAALKEFNDLREITKGLVSGPVVMPAMAMRAGKLALFPLLRYLPALINIIKQGEELTQGTFAPYMDGPKYLVKDKWLRTWLDALAFSLSGLPASRTLAVSMAYVLFDMHRPGAAMDYPKGGIGKVVQALVKGVEQGSRYSKVRTRSHVESLDTNEDGTRMIGLTLKGGKKIVARDGVIFNAPVWSLNSLLKNDMARQALSNSLQYQTRQPRQSWILPDDSSGKLSTVQTLRPTVDASNAGIEDNSLLAKCDTAEMTGSFLHLHVALNSTGLDLDSMDAHYTVMDRGLGGDEAKNGDGPCAELNMIAVSNPCVLDRSLAPEGYIVLHAYCAANEPFEIWNGVVRQSTEYQDLKHQRAEVLWRAVEAVIPDARSRAVLNLVGSPITHERFLRRPRGTYGSATEDYLKDGSTPLNNLVLCGDGIFPGIGLPAVAANGASAANAMVNPLKHWRCLDQLKKKSLI